VEYKGHHLLAMDETKSKRAIGEFWAATMKGKGAFVMPSIPPGTRNRLDYIEREIMKAIASLT